MLPLKIVLLINTQTLLTLLLLPSLTKTANCTVIKILVKKHLKFRRGTVVKAERHQYDIDKRLKLINPGAKIPDANDIFIVN